MDNLFTFPLEQMERLEKEFNVQIHLVQTPEEEKYFFKKDDQWSFAGHNIMECELTIREVCK